MYFDRLARLARLNVLARRGPVTMLRSRRCRRSRESAAPRSTACSPDTPARSSLRPINRARSRRTPRQAPSHARERKALEAIARARELASPSERAYCRSRAMSPARSWPSLHPRCARCRGASRRAWRARGRSRGEWLTAQVPVEACRHRARPGSGGGARARLSYSTSTMDEIRASGLRRRVDRDEFSGATGRERSSGW